MASKPKSSAEEEQTTPEQLMEGEGEDGPEQLVKFVSLVTKLTQHLCLADWFRVYAPFY